MSLEEMIETYCMDGVVGGCDLPTLVALSDGTQIKALSLRDALIPTAFAIHEELVESADIVSIERSSVSPLDGTPVPGYLCVVAVHVAGLIEPTGSVTACAMFNNEWIFERLEAFEGEAVVNCLPELMAFRAITLQAPQRQSSSPEEAWQVMETMALDFTIQRAQRST